MKSAFNDSTLPRCYHLTIHRFNVLTPWLPALLSLLLLNGCAVGPNYKRPPLDVPANFRGAPPAPATNSLADLAWWELFRDPELQDLIRAALTNNYDLRVAVARVEQARAIVVQNRAAFFPQLNYQGEASRGKNSLGTNPFFNNGATVDVFALAGNVAWEVDLWGRIRRLNEAARAQYLASQDARRAVMITVISDVAQAYFQLLALDQQLIIARQSTNSFGESLRIFSQRLVGGVVSKLETSAAEASLAAAAATVPAFKRQIAFQENLLNVLIGRNPGPVPRHRVLLQETLPPEIPAGLPSALLARRPDILQAEQLLRSANAQVGVTVADFFPRLSLTGLFGQVSPELATFTAGGANAWNIAATATGPLFQGGRLYGRYRQAQALRTEAALSYQATLLYALQEVANDLIAIQTLEQQRVEQARAVQAYQVAVQVSLERYIAGKASYYEVLQEQQQLFPAENNLVQVQAGQLLAVVQLYRALGGGWLPQEAGQPGAPAAK